MRAILVNGGDGAEGGRGPAGASVEVPSPEDGKK
jgi:hypothetical protein